MVGTKSWFVALVLCQAPVGTSFVVRELRKAPGSSPSRVTSLQASDKRRPWEENEWGRRPFLRAPCAATFLLGRGNRATAAAESLLSRLRQRDAKALTKPTFNLPPGLQHYPDFFLGDWETTVSFNGYEFPTVDGLSKQDLVSDVNVAGFQKLSIAFLVDVGKPMTKYRTRWMKDRESGATVEDRAFNYRFVRNCYFVYS